MMPSSRVALLVVTLLALALQTRLLGSPITVSTDKDTYHPGDRVVVRGTAQPGSLVAIQVTDPQGLTVWVDQQKASSDGKFTSSFRLKSDARLGTYTVYASASEGKATASFKVVEKAPKPSEPAYKKEAAAALSAARRDLNLISELILNLTRVVDSPNASKLLDKAFTMLEKAEDEFSAGNYEDAMKKARQADRFAAEAWDTAVNDFTAEVRGSAERLGRIDDWMIARLINLSLASLEEAPLDAPSSRAVETLLLAYDLVRIAGEIEDLRYSVGELSSRVGELEERVKELEANLSAVLDERNELEKRVEEIKSENTKLRLRVQELEGEVQNYVKERDKALEEKRKLEERVVELESRLRGRVAQWLTGLVEGIIGGLVVGALLAFFTLRLTIRGKK